MKEYNLENGKEVTWKKIEPKLMNLEDYKKAHEGLVIPCHDVFIKYGDGILLVNRDNFPAKDVLWPIGGRIKRGIKIIDSLKKKTKEECGLDLLDIKEIGQARTIFRTSPFNHEKGTDTINNVYFAKGVGKINLDSLHSTPTIITAEKYKEIRENLHPYVKDFMDIVIKLIS